MNIDFPYHFDSTGRTATAGDADHIREMIEQFVFVLQSGIEPLKIRAILKP